MLQKYILKDGKIVETDLLTWAAWFENPANRAVEKTDVGGVTVSTVFIGMGDLYGNWMFETMIFGGGPRQGVPPHRDAGRGQAGAFRVGRTTFHGSHQWMIG